MFGFIKRLFKKKPEPKPSLGGAVQRLNARVAELELDIGYIASLPDCHNEAVKQYATRAMFNLESLRDEALILYRKKLEDIHARRLKSSQPSDRISKGDSDQGGGSAFLN